MILKVENHDNPYPPYLAFLSDPYCSLGALTGAWSWNAYARIFQFHKCSPSAQKQMFAFAIMIVLSIASTRVRSPLRNHDHMANPTISVTLPYQQLQFL